MAIGVYIKPDAIFSRANCIYQNIRYDYHSIGSDCDMAFREANGARNRAVALASLHRGAEAPEEQLDERIQKTVNEMLERKYDIPKGDERKYWEELWRLEDAVEGKIHELITQGLMDNGHVVFRGYHFRTQAERDGFAVKAWREGLVASALVDIPQPDTMFEFETPPPSFPSLPFSASDAGARYFARLDKYGAIVKVSLGDVPYRFLTYGYGDNKQEDFRYAWLAEVRVEQPQIPSGNILSIEFIQHHGS
ncbi:MAG: hypothetical protein KGH72_04510 [Candidatus Micrarchaeota archaeon]|nr:hypothetical protein [Candidatus Micrarchaeota archaeon]